MAKLSKPNGPKPIGLTIAPNFQQDWLDHATAWSPCQLCNVCRTRPVLARGNIPCEFLFIGEAPGQMEDATGYPFVGPAGKLLDEWLEKAKIPSDLTAFTNAVVCAPRTDPESFIGSPSDAMIAECEPRLLSFVQLAQPTYIVFVGKHAKKTRKPINDLYKSLSWSPPITAEIQHPAFMLRRPRNELLLTKRIHETLRDLSHQFHHQTPTP